MNELYRLDVLSVSEKYIIPKLNENIEKMKPHFYRDELWYLDHNTETIPVSDEGGIDIPDVISFEDLLFFSDKLKKFLEKQGVDYIFYKKVVISDEVFGIEEVFWLASVPRIDCIDFERSKIEDKDDYDYNDGIVPFYNIENPVINPVCCGRYEIFRILGAVSNTVYLKEELYRKLSNERFIGAGFRKI